MSPKQNVQTKKLLPRIPVTRRGEPREIREDEASWAVSYADMLMVLLSFFILFFSLGENQSKSIIRAIAMHVGEKEGNSTNALAQPAHRSSVDLDEIAKSLGLKVVTEGNKLVIYMPDDIYAPGHIELREEARSTVETTFDRLKPYSDKIRVMIIGHADAEPVVKGKKRYLKDNLDLGVFRASSARQFARNSGFKDEQVSVKSGGTFLRNSRTLSLVIEDIGETKL